MSELLFAATVATALGGLVILARFFRGAFHMIGRANAAWELLQRELTPNGGGSTYDRIHSMAHDLRTQRLLLELHLRDPQAHPPKEDAHG